MSKKEYILLGKHRFADGKILNKGDSIKLSPEQAKNLSNKIEDPKAIVIKEDGTARQMARIKELESKIAEMSESKLTAESLWNVYCEAVGGKTYDGKPLPKFSELGTQMKGWEAVAAAK